MSALPSALPSIQTRSRRVRVPLLRPRWQKVLSDLWGNKVRTLLVVASVAVGLFAIGMMTTIFGILTTDIRASYAAVNPANLLINSGPFDDDMVETAGNVRGVKDAEGVRSFDLMVRSGPDEWSRISLRAYEHIERMKTNRLQWISGGEPADHEIVIERNKLGDLYFAESGVVEVKLPSGKIRALPLAGVVHDQTVGIASTGGGFFMAPIQGLISTDALEWLEQPDRYNLMYVTVQADGDDAAHLREVSNRVTQAIEDNNGLVYNAMIRGTHDHPNAAYVDAISGVLLLLGLLVVFLSAFLITNTLSALLNQQAQQIAIMKTVGARSSQITGIYMALIAAFGLLALAISLPLSQEAAFRLLGFLSEKINFDVVSYRTVPAAVALQAVIALVVPQAAGILPVLRGARMKVQEGISGSGSGKGTPGVKSSNNRKSIFAGRKEGRAEASSPVSMPEQGRAARTSPITSWSTVGAVREPPLPETSVAGIRGGQGPVTARVRRRWISRPVLISLRNTFRHKGRLALTLITLTLGGAIFIATFNVQASMEAYIRKLGHYFMADVNLTMDQPYRMSEIEAALGQVAGVTRVEGWSFARCELLLENDKTGDAVQLLGPPVNSSLIQPILIKGRWIGPDDQNAIVLSERFLSEYPRLKVGDSLRLRVNGDKTRWVVVGFFQLAGKSAGFVAYTGYDYLSELIHQRGKAVTYRVTAGQAGLDTAGQRALGARIERYLQRRGYNITDVNAGQSLIDNSARGLNVLTSFLMLMAVLTAIVGSIGLMGTMSMNVLDRTREIGVLRAIGASDRAVMNLVIVEGVLIGLISWVLGALASRAYQQAAGGYHPPCRVRRPLRVHLHTLGAAGLVGHGGGAGGARQRHSRPLCRAPDHPRSAGVRITQLSFLLLQPPLFPFYQFRRRVFPVGQLVEQNEYLSNVPAQQVDRGSFVGPGWLVLLHQDPMELVDQPVDGEDFLFPGPALRIDGYIAREGCTRMPGRKLPIRILRFGFIHPPAHLPATDRAAQQRGRLVQIALDDGGLPLFLRSACSAPSLPRRLRCIRKCSGSAPAVQSRLLR